MFPLLVGIAIMAPASPAPPVSLAELFEEARRKNPDIRAARARGRATAAAVAPAGAFEDPMLMVQFWNMPVDLSVVPLMVSLTQPIPLGGKRAARRDEAQAMAEASRDGVTTVVRDVEAQIAKAYFDLFLADRTMAVDDEIGRTLRSLVAAASSRLAAGRGEESEVLRAESEELKVRSDREAASARRSAAVAKLVALLDRPPGSDMGPTGEPALLPSLPPQEALRERALRERPELGVSSAAAAAAEARLRAARAEKTPDVAVSAGEMHVFRGVARPADFLFLGVQGNLPIFGSKNGAHVETAQAGLASMREETHALENRVMAEIADAFAEVQAEQRQTELHHQLVPLSHQALASALASYSAGRGGFPMVLDAERDLQMHQLDLAMHMAAYSQHLADLERAVGGDIGLVRAATSGTHMSHEE
ncbi:MAG TPA: TolC family protein [Polyangia bacterium]|jgi:outer membrane protein TolC